jgi:DNA-binding response OmpR family regulator
MNENIRRKVLIVDGNVPITKFLKLKLESAGFEVAVAPDMEKAIASAPSKRTDVVALASPMLEGTQEAVGKLRKALGCPVMVYGLGNYSREEKQALNADHWIERFYEPDEFLKAVETVLEHKPQCGK